MQSQQTGTPKSNQWLSAYVEIFHTHVFVCVGSREEMLDTGDDALSKMNFTDEAVKDIGDALVDAMPDIYQHVNCGECLCVRTKNNGTVNFIRLDKFEPANGPDICTLAHECLHCAINILETCGVEETGNYECLCYLHEMIFSAFLKEFHKKE